MEDFTQTELPRRCVPTLPSQLPQHSRLAEQGPGGPAGGASGLFLRAGRNFWLIKNRLAGATQLSTTSWTPAAQTVRHKDWRHHLVSRCPSRRAAHSTCPPAHTPCLSILPRVVLTALFCLLRNVILSGSL